MADATTSEISFVGATGAHLSGVLHLPEDPTGSVLLAHCFTCSKDLHTMTRLADSLADRGYAVLRFDFTGLGDSGGEFTASTVSANIGDLTRATVALLERGYGPCGLVGHSLGGAAVLLAAHRLKTVRSIVTIGAPASPGHVRGLFADSTDEIRASGEAVITVAGRDFPISADFLEDLDRHDQADATAELGRPLLVVHATDDEVVPISEGEKIFAAADQPKAFWAMPGADHLLTRREDADRAAQVVGSWLDWTR
ncbi:MAG: alpha/beta hydrolase [Acidimicrobiales bacterium]